MEFDFFFFLGVYLTGIYNERYDERTIWRQWLELDF